MCPFLALPSFLHIHPFANANGIHYSWLCQRDWLRYFYNIILWKLRGSDEGKIEGKDGGREDYGRAAAPLSHDQCSTIHPACCFHEAARWCPLSSLAENPLFHLSHRRKPGSHSRAPHREIWIRVQPRYGLGFCVISSLYFFFFISFYFLFLHLVWFFFLHFCFTFFFSFSVQRIMRVTRALARNTGNYANTLGKLCEILFAPDDQMRN